MALLRLSWLRLLLFLVSHVASHSHSHSNNYHDYGDNGNGSDFWMLACVGRREDVALFQCFAAPAADTDGGPPQPASRCCEAAHRFLREERPALLRSSDGSGCPGAPIAVPPAPAGFGDSAATAATTAARSEHLLPSHAWVVAPRAAAPEPPLPPPESEGDFWECSLWGGGAGATLARRALTPATHNDRAAAANHPDNRGPPAGSFRATLRSELSESGGMHRELRHSVSLELPESADDAGHFELDLLALLSIPSGMFVNVEDAFDPKQSQMRLTLTTVDDDVIDEEQPEFASPGHAVLVRIRGPVLRHRSGLLEFATKVHLRYPAPVSGADAYSRVVLSAPVLVAGTLSTVATGGGMHRLEVPEDRIRLPPPPLVAWASAGREEDLAPVAFVTLLASAVGTAIMLRSISQAAVWH